MFGVQLGAKTSCTLWGELLDSVDQFIEALRIVRTIMLRHDIRKGNMFN